MENKWHLVNFCELDKYAVKSYCAIHNVDESLNLGDITKVDISKLPDFDTMTWGFPCTDISVAGKQKGFIDENGEVTRSGLYYEGIKILREKKPILSIIENVKNLVGKKFKNEFEMILSDLEEAGYNNYWQVLNAKNYGVPQNRERVFIVSIRKDWDMGNFKFPEGFDNGIRLKDVLEKEVDEKYYISQEKVDEFLQSERTMANYLRKGSMGATGVLQFPENSYCLDSNYYRGTTVEQYQKKHRRQIVPDGIRIRKLTPKECFRLMGFDDWDFEMAGEQCSNSQLYKQAGNSIVVDVLYYILLELYKAMPYLFDDLKLCSLFSGIGAFESALDRSYEAIESGNFT